MEIKPWFLTQNDCYKSATPMTPRGIVIHSTGANNPYLKRYVQPDDGYIGINPYGNSWNQPGVDVCVHAMIGKDKNGAVRCYQLLPWDIAAWGVGRGSKGSYNYNPTGHIQFEICEDALSDRAYFNAAFGLAEDLCAYLCDKFGLPVSSVVSHKEAAALGYASAHGDPENWLSQFHWDMEHVRAQIQSRLDKMEAAAPDIYRIRKTWADAASQIGAYRILENAIRACPPGYTVFDSKGNAIYTNTGTADDTSALKQQIEELKARLTRAEAESQTLKAELEDKKTNLAAVTQAVKTAVGTLQKAIGG